MTASPGERGAGRARFPERLLVAVAAVGAVAAQYLLRGLDDNRLTSWAWVFGREGPAVLFALVAGAALAAQAAASLPSPRRPAAVLFACAFAAGACLWGEPEAIVDAARYFTQAKHLALYGPVHFAREWGREIPAWTDLPLVPALYGLALRLSGESRAGVQLLSTLLFAGTAALAFRIGRALWDEETGLAAGALLLAMPYLLVQVPAMLVDVPTMFLVALAVDAAIGALRDGGAARIGFAVAALAAALLSKYSAALLLTALFPLVAVRLREGERRALLRGAAVAAGAGIVVLAAIVSHRDVFARQLALLAGYQAPGLRRWGESFLSTFVFQLHPFVSAAALASIWVAIRRRDLRWIVAAWPVLLLLALEVRRARYLVPAFPMVALLAARGLSVLRTPATRRAVVASAALSSLVVAVDGDLRFLRTTSAMNLKEAGSYLDRLDEPAVEVMTAGAEAPAVNPAVSVPILDLFTRKRLVYRDEGLRAPSGAAALASPLRFTWELGVAPWYAARGAEDGAAIAVVSDDPARPLPARVVERLGARTLDRAFEVDEGVFQHRTVVRIYRLRSAATPAAAAGGGGRRPGTRRPCSRRRGRRRGT